MLDPFELQNMRYRWRKWGIFDCNWKVALEAFNETYHVQTTHPEFNKFGEFRGWARAQGKHSNIGYDAPKGMDENQSAKMRLGTGDPRISTAEMQVYTWEKANTNTTQTLVDAALAAGRRTARRHAGRPGAQALAGRRRGATTRRAAWSGRPSIPRMSARAAPPGRSSRTSRSATPSTTRCATARGPAATTRTSASSRRLSIELYPKGEEPQTGVGVLATATAEAGATCCPQDFSNMAAVQQGMKSLGFSGTKPNPYMERSTVNLHRNLAKYMGTGAPRKLE